jgi:3-isopropylmalate/(R)-2-methylmalate dehydratase small subunit
MQAFTELDGLVAPLDRSNVDTDAIIPKQFLKSIHKTGFGPYLFDAWRYRDEGQPGQDCSRRPLQEDFVLNQPRYQGARILLARDNFGCGSSREHAVWALKEYGFHCIIAPSFADIFYSNCGKNGVLALTLKSETLDRLFRDVRTTPGYHLKVNLAAQSVTTPSGDVISFEIDPALKQRLLQERILLWHQMLWRAQE